MISKFTWVCFLVVSVALLPGIFAPLLMNCRTPMTGQHRLTDDIIRYDKKLGCHDLGTWIYTEDDLRTAADWQLEKVLDWLKNCRDYDLFHIKDRALMRRDLRKAMRPTTATETP